MYRYAKDAAPGDTKGHGVGGTWNALAANGAKAGLQQSGGEEKSGGQEESAGSGDVPQLRATESGDLGRILVDGKDRTLYRFDKDSAWPMKSNCTGSCLETWQPAKAVGRDRLRGVDRKLVSTYERADGTRQLAIDCWPVYWFTGDTEPGDTNGHGSKGLWWAVTDEGEKASG